MRKDPRRTDRCPQCRKPMPPITKTMRTYAGPQIDAEPFCSTGCCKAWHRVEFRWSPTTSTQGYEPPMQLEHSINPREIPLPAGGPGT